MKCDEYVVTETETEYQLLMMETQISRKSEMFRAASLSIAGGQLSLHSCGHQMRN